MNVKRLTLVVCAISLGISLGAPSVSAADNESPDNNQSATKESSAPFNELNSSHDRGASFTPILTPPVVAPLIVTPTATPRSTVKSPVTTVTKPINQTRKASIKSPQKIVKAGKKSPQSSNPAVAKATIPARPNDLKTNNVSSAAAPHHQGTAVSAWLDRAGNNPQYKVTEEMVVNVSANTDCNVIVFNYDSQGVLTQIFPNDYQQSGFIRAGETIQIGGPDSPFKYEISGKGGAEKIFVYSYPIDEKHPLEIAMNPIPNTPFRSTEMTAEKYRELVNSSKVFFSRGVKVMRRSTAQGIPQVMTAASTTTTTSPNKVELPFTVVPPNN